MSSACLRCYLSIISLQIMYVNIVKKNVHTYISYIYIYIYGKLHAFGKFFQIPFSPEAI